MKAGKTLFLLRLLSELFVPNSVEAHVITGIVALIATRHVALGSVWVATLPIVPFAHATSSNPVGATGKSGAQPRRQSEPDRDPDSGGRAGDRVDTRFGDVEDDEIKYESEQGAGGCDGGGARREA